MTLRIQLTLRLNEVPIDQKQMKVRVQVQKKYIINILMQAMRKRKEANEKNSERATCSICLERKPNAQLNNCLHIFCLKCIRRWSKKRANCPLCRRVFTIIQDPLRQELARSVSISNTIEERFPSGLASVSLVMPVFYFSTPLQPLYMNQGAVCVPYFCSGMSIFTSFIYDSRQSIPSLF